MIRVFILIYLILFLAGCGTMPIRDGKLVIGKDTTAGVEDMGVAAVNQKF